MNMHVRHPDEVLAPKEGGADHRFDHFRFQRACDFLRLNRYNNATILDLGCHQGEFLKFLNSPYNNLHGTDTWASTLPGPWTYHWCDLETDFPPIQANVISCFEVIEHLIDTDGFLERVHDHLRPGGWLVLSTPNINSLRNRVLVPFGVYPSGLEWHNVIHHVRLYNTKVLLAQLRQVGFVHCSIRGIAALPLSSSWGTGRLSQWLANWFPSLCNNIMVIAQKGLEQ